MKLYFKPKKAAAEAMAAASGVHYLDVCASNALMKSNVLEPILKLFNRQVSTYRFNQVMSI